MLQDPNVDRIVKQQLAPLIKRIAKLEQDVKELKNRKPTVVYQSNLPNN